MVTVILIDAGNPDHTIRGLVFRVMGRARVVTGRDCIAIPNRPLRAVNTEFTATAIC
mgnify:CR=1 FL=1